jgi:hypothetical protein
MDTTDGSAPQRATSSPLIDDDTLALAFLKLVLPQTGQYAAAIKPKTGKFRQRFYATIELLSQGLRDIDRDGDDAYFLTASLGQELNRTAENVDMLKCLRLDVDFGSEGHQGVGYATKEEALVAVKKFYMGACLPPPIVVFSGGGLHIYWPLTAALPRSDWLRYAEGLKAACIQRELKADHTITANAAGVLRAPFTTNRKLPRKPRKVELNPLFLGTEPYALAHFEPLLQYKMPAPGRADKPISKDNVIRFPFGPKPDYLKNLPAGSLMDALLGGFGPSRNADAEMIANECAQLCFMRETRGVMPEPAWYACIGVLAFCEGGEALAHEWSKGDKRYDPKETQRKFDAWREMTGPTRCERFLDFDDATRARCEACPHSGKISSPIFLGARPAPAERGAESTATAKATTNETFIEEINKKHFLIGNIGGKCMMGEKLPNPAGTGQMLSLQTVDAFKTRYGNRFVRVHDGQGNARRKPLGAYWLQHRDRREYEGVVLIPNAPGEVNGMLNLWCGFGVEQRQGDWTLMMHHVCFVLAGGDQRAAEYILRWAAWSLQHPGERAEVALVLQGGKGSGKGLFLRSLSRCFGEHGLQISNQEHLIGKFNSHLRTCLFLFADEAFWAGNKRGESVLKGLITEPVLMIEQKGIDPVQWPNRLHVAMAANADWVVPASAGERRYAVFKCADTYVRDQGDAVSREAYFKALHRELENGGLEAMLYDLRHWELGEWHPRQIYETEGLREQKQHSLGPLEGWLAELLDEGKLPGCFIDRKDFSPTRALVDDAKLRTPRAGDWLSAKSASIFLRKQGCIPEKYKRGDTEARGWKFPRLAEMRQAWAKQYGGWDWSAPGQDDWK